MAVASPTAPELLVVDDDAREATVSGYIARDAGFKPNLVTDLGNMEDVLNQVATRHPSGVLCDHRLRPRSAADFDGAALVARLTELGVPSVLVTTFVRDADVSIRLHRAKIPALLLRDELTPEALQQALTYSRAEIAGEIAPERRPYEVVLRIAAIVAEGAVPVAEAIIPNWNPVEIVRFPIELIPLPLRPGPLDNLIDQHLLASVNTGAERSEDLYFHSFRLVPAA